MTTIAQQLGQLEQDIYALAKRPSSEVLLAIDSRLSAIRAAVGGEAVAAKYCIHKFGVDPYSCERCNWNAVTDEDPNEAIERKEIARENAATVDVEALRELVTQWRHNAQGCSRNDAHAAGTWRSCARELAALIGEEV